MGRRAGVVVARTGLALALLMSLMVLAATPTAAAYKGTNGGIVFSSNRAPGDGVHLFRMNSSGGAVAQLTFGTAIDRDPVWSPGGTRIAFTRYATPTSPGDIYVIDADGSNLRRLTSHPADEWGPSWSADGHWIYFTGDRRQALNYDIWVMNRDGSDVRKAAASGAFDGYVAASPNTPGSFAMMTARSGSMELRITDISSGLSNEIAAPGDLPLAPDQHPVGSYNDLIFESWQYFPQVDAYGAIAIWRAGDLHQQITPREDAFGPAWSPDGERILYASPINDPNPDDSVEVFDIYVKVGYDGPVTRITSNTSSYAVDPNWQPIPEFPLVDSKFHPNDADIRWLYEAGITGGCTAELYCPRSDVTRGQMAAFLTRAFDLPPATTDHFLDDETSPYEDPINRVAEAGITTGCGGPRFCPKGVVSRAQMAGFLSRALELPDATVDHFTDDNGHLLEDHINRLAESGITGGCGEGTFCPSSPVTRGQMAAFLHRGLEPD